MEDERKTKIANVLIREHTKLPLTMKEKEYIQWGDNYKIRLGINIKEEVLLSFGFSDLDGFDYLYSKDHISYDALVSILKSKHVIIDDGNHPSYKHLKKVVTVMVFYHSDMQRVRDI